MNPPQLHYHPLISALAFLLFFSGNVLGQRGPSSFYFSQPQPSETPASHHFDPSFVGSYLSTNDSLSKLMVSDSALEKEFLRVATIPKVRIDTTEAIFIRNDHIHGIKKGDSLEVIDEGDTVYAFWYQRSVIFKMDGESQLLKEKGDTFFLNFLEKKGQWTVMLFHKNKEGNLVFRNFNHDEAWPQIDRFPKMDTIPGKHFKTYIGTPGKGDLERVMQTKAFGKGEEFFQPKGEDNP